MKPVEMNPYDALEKIFHEPNRLAIMSSLAAAADGMTFTQLKAECNLTDGNLSRHLKALEEADAIVIEKEFVGAKPRTTVYLSEEGSDRFVDYLRALEKILEDTGAFFREEKPVKHQGFSLKGVRTAGSS